MELRMIGPTPPADGVERQAELMRAINPIFAGQHPAVVGATILELHALLMAGTLAFNHKDKQDLGDRLDSLLELHANGVRALVPDIVQDMREGFNGVSQVDPSANGSRKPQ